MSDFLTQNLTKFLTNFGTIQSYLKTGNLLTLPTSSKKGKNLLADNYRYN